MLKLFADFICACLHSHVHCQYSYRRCWCGREWDREWKLVSRDWILDQQKLLEEEQLVQEREYFNCIYYS